MKRIRTINSTPSYLAIFLSTPSFDAFEVTHLQHNSGAHSLLGSLWWSNTTNSPLFKLLAVTECLIEILHTRGRRRHHKPTQLLLFISKRRGFLHDKDKLLPPHKNSEALYLTPTIYWTGLTWFSSANVHTNNKTSTTSRSLILLFRSRVSS